MARNKSCVPGYQQLEEVTEIRAESYRRELLAKKSERGRHENSSVNDNHRSTQRRELPSCRTILSSFKRNFCISAFSRVYKKRATKNGEMKKRLKRIKLMFKVILPKCQK